MIVPVNRGAGVDAAQIGVHVHIRHIVQVFAAVNRHVAGVGDVDCSLV